MAGMTDGEYQEKVKDLWNRINRDFPNATIAEIKDEDGRAWPIPLPLLLKIDELPNSHPARV